MKWMPHVIAVMAFLASCRGPEVTLIPESELPQDVYGEPVTRANPPGGIPEEGVVYLVKEGRLEEVRRSLPPARSLPEALLLALLEGGAISGTDLDTAIPRNTRLISLRVEQDIAIVDLSGEFDSGATGVPQLLRLAQVVYTLTQEQTGIIELIFFVEGEQRGVVIGSGIVVTSPVGREHYERFAPPEELPGEEGSPQP